MKLLSIIYNNRYPLYVLITSVVNNPTTTFPYLDSSFNKLIYHSCKYKQSYLHIQFNSLYIIYYIIYYIILIYMETFKLRYEQLCQTPSDINEHLPTLFKYAQNCKSITEFGTRNCTSTYAFIYGLLNNDNSKYTGVDLIKSKDCEIVEKLCENLNLDFNFIEDSDINIDIDETDILFIDSWHIYGQLIRELEKHHSKVKKYIILHDTTIDEFKSEIIRIPDRWNNPQKKNYQKIIKDSGFTKYELETGLWPAVIKFLEDNSNWKIKERFINNNGLTILEKIN
jgi:hypothetical protein